MKLQLRWKAVDWWFWTITLALISLAVGGWEPGYRAVIAISAIQTVYFAAIQRSLISFDVQVRALYLAFTLAGLCETVRLPFYIFLLIGTIMVVFFGRCGIALVLRRMPWNSSHMACPIERGGRT